MESSPTITHNPQNTTGLTVATAGIMLLPFGLVQSTDSAALKHTETES